ncbi:hypothetical protein [Arcobacter arenosus]|jgi:hypothetical protein|uniref:Uncharacterized protein n=1 Tax=Arcobacter arenosus TaxID=2576037 RepID=A0A5R8Y530_9BACT|nr:hypothetical protein [Arcobacter arenosus]TLP40773.1 hypothetical protein FDK22_01790 [Arcobacter arenosus]
MLSLLYLHLIASLIIFLNLLIFSRNESNDLGTKYFLVNYIYHKHKNLSCFIISFPYIIILIYFLLENVILIGTFFISVLYTYFLYEIISKKNINKREAYIAWYKQNVQHSLSMHSYDVLKKDYRFLNERISKVFLFKFELIFFVCLVIESEVVYEVLTLFTK